MGIKNFHKFIKQYYNKAFNKEWLLTYDHLYIDVNFSLHHCSYGAKSIEEIYARLFNFLNSLIQEIVPTKTLTLSSDGSAPLSKLMEQRKRRIGIYRNLSEKCEVSSLMFTPGTKFMEDLKLKLNKYLNYIMTVYQIKAQYLDPDIDEAELKLKNQMMKNLNENKNDSHIIVSNDADVIVMLTTLHNYMNVYVYTKMSHQTEILSIGKMMDMHTNKYGTSKNAGFDFAAVNILLGNDYLPKVSYCDFDKLWNSYSSIVKIYPSGMINDEFKINNDFMIKLLFGIVIRTNQNFVKKITIENTFQDVYKTYLDGYTWCINTYYNGKCDRYNYMYEYDESPHPLGLIFNISRYPDLLTYKSVKFDAINPMLYAMLILPKASLNLIDKKYYNFAVKNKSLYEEECCNKCNEFYAKIKKMKKNNVDNDKIVLMVKTMNLHKKQHNDITLSDIEDILLKFKKENFK